jgi:pyruvate kinase
VNREAEYFTDPKLASRERGRRRTKIVATLGPSTDDPRILEDLVRAGADVFRVNFSHGTADEREARVAAIRRAAGRVGCDVGIIGDLQGPKIRIESFRQGPVELEAGRIFTLDTDLDPDDGDETRVGVAYRALTTDVTAGDCLLLDDGRLLLEVEAVHGTSVDCRVLEGGTLGNKKGINMRGGGLSAPALTDKDREDIRQAAQLDFDFVSVSFARKKKDIEEARSLLRAAGGRGHIVAKIERAEAVANIRKIIDASDAIMVARGDLAVEVGYASMTSLQKGLIRLARSRNKVSITATQMLESMINNSSPTRAEISDVANAVMDGTDAVMLSAESAVGKYPVQAVRTMAELCVGAEKHETFSRAANYRMDDTFKLTDEAIAMAVMYTANHLDVKAIAALTESGATTLWMSRVRSGIPIYALTRHEATCRRVKLYRGVYPFVFDVTSKNPSDVYERAFKLLLEDGVVVPGDRIVFTKGEFEGVAGGTNTMQILTVPNPAKRATTSD